MNITRTLWMFSIAIGLTASGQAADAARSSVETEVAAQTAPYLVIDLAPRRLAITSPTDPAGQPQPMAGFATSNLLAIPPGGWTDEYKTTKLVLRRIPAGTFKMGSPGDEPGRDADETQHPVTITKDFYISVFEVTMKQWELVMGKAAPGHTRRKTTSATFKKDKDIPELDCRPVEMITHYEIRESLTTDPDTARAILAKRPPRETKKTAASDKPAAGVAASPLDDDDDELSPNPSDTLTAQKAAQAQEKKSEENALQAIMNESSDDPNVDWPANNAVNPKSFFGKLRAKTLLNGLDLPTEAQWEYACRAGTTTPLNSGKSLTQWTQCPNMAEVGRYMGNQVPSEWFWSKSRDPLSSSVVGSYAPNPWGLYDMHGNVWEWCLDWYGPLSSEAAIDPKGPASGQTRVVRGGSWDDRAKACRSANRGPNGNPGARTPFVGFRMALTLP